MVDKSEIDNDMIIENIKKALINLYINDEYLIRNKPLDRIYSKKRRKFYHVSERGIVFRFGIYLNNLIRENPILNGYHLDAEYNRNMYEKKALYSFTNGTYPDLILHLRNSNKYNLLIMEFKPWWNNKKQERERDIQKTKEFVLHYNYKYKLGIFAVLGIYKVFLNVFDGRQNKYYLFNMKKLINEIRNNDMFIYPS